MSKEPSPDVVEGNKLIAIFDGYAERYNKFWRNHAWTTISGLNYHKDWNRLMPVVEKINDLALDNYGEIGVIIYPGKCDIVAGSDCNEMIVEGMTGNSFIDSAWQTVVQFIQWYNKNLNHERKSIYS